MPSHEQSRRMSKKSFWFKQVDLKERKRGDIDDDDEIDTLLDIDYLREQREQAMIEKALEGKFPPNKFVH